MTAHAETRAPLLDIAPEALPEEAQGSLDPDQPLPPGHVFLPLSPGRIVPQTALAAGAFASGLIFLRGLLLDEGAVLKGIYALVGVGLLLAGMVPARRVLRVLRDRLAHRRGRWRRGLHVMRHALLQWDGQTASWIPRASIEGLRVSPHERRTMVDVRLDDGQTGRVELEAVPPPKTSPEGSGEPTLFEELAAWITRGEFRTPRPQGVELPAVLRAWLRNVLVGHGVLAVLSLVGLVVLTAVAHLFGRPAGALLGLLLGVPAFLGFPLILSRLAGHLLASGPGRGAQSRRPAGWGYQMLLGLAALFVYVAGSEAAGSLWWQLRAGVDPAATLSSIEASAGSPIFHRWPEGVVPSDSALGHHTSRFFLGDSSWVESTFYVAPLIGPAGTRAPCVWIGLKTSEGILSAKSKGRLRDLRGDWLIEAAGLERSGYRKAVEEALKASQFHRDSCQEVTVVEASASRPEEVLASLKALALLLGLAHGLPLLMLAGWALVQWDRRGPTPARGRGSRAGLRHPGP